MAQRVEKTPPKTKPNYLYAIVSVALVLFLLGFFGLMILEANNLVRLFKEKVNLMIELEEGTSEEARTQLITFLENSPFLKETSITYISKEEGAAMLRNEFGEDFLKLDLPNPLYDVITFNVNAAYLNQDSLQKIRTTIMRHTYVNDVFYQESLVDEIVRNIEKIGYIALGIGVFFIFVAITLIHNTIRLALYANRFLIKNMELVGASWEFISRPYLIRSAQHGFFSALLAISVLLLLLFLAGNEFPELNMWQNLPAIVLLFISLTVLGVLISTFSTYYVVNKYLKMRVDDLY